MENQHLASLSLGLGPSQSDMEQEMLGRGTSALLLDHAHSQQDCEKEAN